MQFWTFFWRCDALFIHRLILAIAISPILTTCYCTILQNSYRHACRCRNVNSRHSFYSLIHLPIHLSIYLFSHSFRSSVECVSNNIKYITRNAHRPQKTISLSNIVFFSRSNGQSNNVRVLQLFKTLSLFILYIKLYYFSFDKISSIEKWSMFFFRKSYFLWFDWWICLFIMCTCTLVYGTGQTKRRTISVNIIRDLNYVNYGHIFNFHLLIVHLSKVISS